MNQRLAFLLGLFLITTACSTSTADPVTDSTGSTTTVTPSTTTVPATTTTGAITATTAIATTSVATATTAAPLRALAEFELDVVPVADGFDQPIMATHRAGDPRLFVADQPGVVYAIDLDTGDRTVVLDISPLVRFSGEQGLLGLAFHPTDPDRMVVHYSDSRGTTIVSEYLLGADGIADRATARTILTQSQPASNHNGGSIEFGPDGYLYLGLGDGGGANDQFGQGQDPFSLLGTVVRVDIDSGDPYSIPSDNPFVDGRDGAPEVWAWGMRNPWRFSFDGDDLWIGDVGQGQWEEIDRLDVAVPGANAGWPLLEGTHCFAANPCDFDNLVGPVLEYRHENGRCSVTGGVVYRGSAIADLDGTYLYGDYCTGEIWGLRTDGFDQRRFTDSNDVFLPPLSGLTSFGVGPDGEVYVLQAAGIVWRLVGA